VAYRGIEPVHGPTPLGHEYVGIVEEVGDAVRTIEPGQFVVGSFWDSDNTCEICRRATRARAFAASSWAPSARRPSEPGPARRRHPRGHPRAAARGPDPELPRRLRLLGTGWFGAVAAEAGPGKTVVVVGDGAVGLLAVLAARQLGAERIIAVSRHVPRQKLAREFGAADIVEERGDEGVARVKELMSGLGAHSVVEAVGTHESMMQAIRSTRPGGHVGFVAVLHDVELPDDELFFSQVHLHGGPAPVRRFLPQLVDLIGKTGDRPRQGLRPDVAA
jgi:threonine dehydrogenase-like Zn-dependent dehydrogenase